MGVRDVNRNIGPWSGLLVSWPQNRVARNCDHLLHCRRLTITSQCCYYCCCCWWWWCASVLCICVIHELLTQRCHSFGVCSKTLLCIMCRSATVDRVDRLPICDAATLESGAEWTKQNCCRYYW